MYRYTYAVRLLRPGRYRAELIESKNPAAIGKVAELEFKIDRDQLYLTSYPEDSPGAKVEMVYVRAGGRP